MITFQGCATEGAVLLVPSAPSQAKQLEGYVQVTLTHEGALIVRGTRGVVDWLLCRLADEGWRVELEELNWCG